MHGRTKYTANTPGPAQTLHRHRKGGLRLCQSRGQLSFIIPCSFSFFSGYKQQLKKQKRQAVCLFVLFARTSTV